MFESMTSGFINLRMSIGLQPFPRKKRLKSSPVRLIDQLVQDHRVDTMAADDQKLPAGTVMNRHLSRTDIPVDHLLLIIVRSGPCFPINHQVSRSAPPAKNQGTSVEQGTGPENMPEPDFVREKGFTPSLIVSSVYLDSVAVKGLDGKNERSARSFPVVSVGIAGFFRIDPD